MRRSGLSVHATTGVSGISSQSEPSYLASGRASADPVLHLSLYDAGDRLCCLASRHRRCRHARCRRSVEKVEHDDLLFAVTIDVGAEHLGYSNGHAVRRFSKVLFDRVVRTQYPASMSEMIVGCAASKLDASSELPINTSISHFDDQRSRSSQSTRGKRMADPGHIAPW